MNQNSHQTDQNQITGAKFKPNESRLKSLESKLNPQIELKFSKLNSVESKFTSDNSKSNHWIKIVPIESKFSSDNSKSNLFHD